MTVYSQQGLPESLIGDESYVTGVDYTIMGQLETLSLGNTLNTVYSYNPFTFRLNRTQTENLLDLSYSYDPAGNVTMIQDDTRDEGQGFTYDSLDRLTGVFEELAIGEIGYLDDTLTDVEQTIPFKRVYQNPVVFAQPLSIDGSDKSVVRITEVHNDSFSLYVDEAPNHDGAHGTEAVSYLVVEAGAWELADGTRLEAGKVLNTNVIVGRRITGVWQTVTYANSFSAAPSVFSQVQTENDASFVKTRQRNTTTTGFQMAMEEEENSTTFHGYETLGWLAIEIGEGHWSGKKYLAAQTPNAVTNNWYTISFGADLGADLRFLASIGPYNSSDHCELRYNRMTANSETVSVMVEEDTSYDSETTHASEVVYYLAFAGEGLLGGHPAGSGPASLNYAWTYDAVGNMTSRTISSTVSYAYNDLNHVHAVTDLSNGNLYQYDENGNMVIRYEDDAAYRQIFNAENRLTSVTSTYVWGSFIKTLQPGSSGKDSYVDEKYGNNNYGSSSMLKINPLAMIIPELKVDPTIKNALVEFDLSEIQPVANVSNATLTLYCAKLYPNVAYYPTIKLYRADESWEENLVTWNNQPGTVGGEIGTINLGSTTLTAYSFNVTSLVQGWADESIPNNGIKLISSDTAPAIAPAFCASSDYGTASKRPKLVIQGQQWDFSQSETHQFFYDGDGNRVKTIYPDSSWTAYIGDHYEVESDGTERSYYFLGSQRIAMRIIYGGDNYYYFLHTDHLNSTSLLSDERGDWVPDTEARYLPYGEYRVEPTADLTDIGFTGHKQNDSIGLIFMKARYYAPGLGRFLSADTIVPEPGNPQSFNRYSYVNNRPLNATDPTGHSDCDVHGNCKNGIRPRLSVHKPTDPLPPSYVRIDVKFEGSPYISRHAGAAIETNALLTDNHILEPNTTAADLEWVTVSDATGETIHTVDSLDDFILVGDGSLGGGLTLLVFKEDFIVSADTALLGESGALGQGDLVYQAVYNGADDRGFERGLYETYVDDFGLVTNIRKVEYQTLTVQPDLTTGGDSGSPLSIGNVVYGINNSGLTCGIYGQITDIRLIRNLIADETQRLRAP